MILLIRKLGRRWIHSEDSKNRIPRKKNKVFSFFGFIVYAFFQTPKKTEEWKKTKKTQKKPEPQSKKRPNKPRKMRKTKSFLNYFSRNSSLTSLDLSGWNIADNDIDLILTSCVNISTLILVGCYQLSDKSIVQIGEKLNIKLR